MGGSFQDEKTRADFGRAAAISARRVYPLATEPALIPRWMGAREWADRLSAFRSRLAAHATKARDPTSGMHRTGPKSEETRGRILAAAMELFRRRGFESTTMREIAREAGVALGSAYYYFESKEALVMAFYEQARDEMRPLIVQALSEERDLQGALRAILDARLRYFAPNRKFLGALFGHAANPENPLPPFSEETREIRSTDIGHFEQALERGRVKIPADLKPHLPRLLW